MAWMFTGRGVLGALLSKSCGELENKTNSPQILPQLLGLGKKPSGLGREGQSPSSGEAPAKTLPVLAASEQTPSPGRSQQVSVLHFNSNNLPAWTNNCSRSSLGYPGLPNCTQPSTHRAGCSLGWAGVQAAPPPTPQALPAGELCKLCVLSPSRNAPNLQGVGASAPLVTHLPSRCGLGRQLGLWGPYPKILPAPSEPNVVCSSWVFPPK